MLGDILMKILILDENYKKLKLLMTFYACGYDWTKNELAYDLNLCYR